MAPTADLETDVWRPGQAHRSRSKRVLVDGCEGVQGRALLALSALHLCAPVLRGHFIEVLYCDDPIVSAAAAALATDEDLSVACFSTEESGDRWPRAALYVSVRFREPDTAALRLATEHRVHPFVALQFPSKAHSGLEMMRRVRAAHDPAVLARMIETSLGRGGYDAA